MLVGQENLAVLRRTEALLSEIARRFEFKSERANQARRASLAARCRTVAVRL